METNKARGNPIKRAVKFWFGSLVTSKPWLQTAHLLLDLPLGIATFTLVVTFVSISGSLVITIIGIPLLAGSVLIGRYIGALERQRSLVFLREDLRAPRNFDFSQFSLTFIRNCLTDRFGWKGLFYGVISLPLGIFNFTISVTLWSIAIACSFSLLGLPFLGASDNLIIQKQGRSWELVPWTTYSGLAQAEVILATTIFGLILLGLTPRIINGLVALKQAIVKGLCAESEKEILSERVNVLEESRSASVVGAANELRRIERDLHDGAQQHLVSMAMKLGIAKERLSADGDPAVAEMVEAAHADAKSAIVELRNLVRGIHPAVLTELGLDAAISALAARSPIPVHVEYKVEQRLTQTIEATAYFVVAEALTNSGKHSGASSAWVKVSQRDSWVVIEVGDNGRGGAHEGVTGGLRGLRDRVRSVEGTLTISSPEGGPTSIVAELPCE